MRPMRDADCSFPMSALGNSLWTNSDFTQTVVRR